MVIDKKFVLYVDVVKLIRSKLKNASYFLEEKYSIGEYETAVITNHQVDKKVCCKNFKKFIYLFTRALYRFYKINFRPVFFKLSCYLRSWGQI